MVSQWPEGNRDFPLVIDANRILQCVVTFAPSLDTVLLASKHLPPQIYMSCNGYIKDFWK